jgi:hypothetical protein
MPSWPSRGPQTTAFQLDRSGRFAGARRRHRGESRFRRSAGGRPRLGPGFGRGRGAGATPCGRPAEPLPRRLSGARRGVRQELEQKAGCRVYDVDDEFSISAVIHLTRASRPVRRVPRQSGRRHGRGRLQQIARASPRRPLWQQVPRHGRRGRANAPRDEPDTSIRLVRLYAGRRSVPASPQPMTPRGWVLGSSSARPVQGLSLKSPELCGTSYRDVRRRSVAPSLCRRDYSHVTDSGREDPVVTNCAT